KGRRDAPGVYVAGRKLASIGLRVRRGCSYHGLALNVDMDLEPFARINPCGMAGLSMTQLVDEGAKAGVEDTALALAPLACEQLGLAWDGTWDTEGDAPVAYAGSSVENSRCVALKQAWMRR
ncbi:MAG: lipoyl protein ligase domain-containing protein, partial [Steroidobacteraceae bacterium]